MKKINFHRIIFIGVSGPPKAPKCHVFWIMGKKLVFLPPWFFDFLLEVWFFTPRFGNIWQFWHFRAVLWERPQNDQSLKAVNWFSKNAPWCITCPLIFTLCVASRSNFYGSCHIFQRVVLLPPGTWHNHFPKNECTVVHSFFRRSFLLVDEHIHSAVINGISAVSYLGLHFIRLISRLLSRSISVK